MERNSVERRQRGPEDHIEGVNRLAPIVNGATRRQRIDRDGDARRGEPR